jgi:hypothetical protein
MRLWWRGELVELKTIIHWMSKVLLTAEILFGRLHGCMTEQELNLLKLSTAAVA